MVRIRIMVRVRVRLGTILLISKIPIRKFAISPSGPIGGRVHAAFSAHTCARCLLLSQLSARAPTEEATNHNLTLITNLPLI